MLERKDRVWVGCGRRTAGRRRGLSEAIKMGECGGLEDGVLTMVTVS
jgi:hypothetical protein